MQLKPREVLRLTNSKPTHDSIPAAKVVTGSGLDWTLSALMRISKGAA